MAASALSSILLGRLNQTATWSQFVTRNKENVPTYSAGETIACRLEGARRIVTDINGDRIISSTTVFTLESIGEEDLINGRRVLQVLNEPDGQGNQIFNEVLLQ